MSLRNPPTRSAALVAANRQNAQRSTGPRLPAGRPRALPPGRNAAPPAARETLRALGEDPEELSRLHRRLADAYQPHDPLWAKQVEDLAYLYWRRARLDRARDALLRRELELLEVEKHEQRRTFEQTTLDPIEEVSARQVGLANLADSPGKFRRLLTSLRDVLADADQAQLSAKDLDVLAGIFGKEPPEDPLRLLALVDQSVSSPGAFREEDRLQLRRLLEEEILRAEEAFDLYQQHHLEVTAAQRQALAAPTRKEWALIIRQENVLDRAIDRKVRLLLSFRRAHRREAERRGVPPRDSLSEKETSGSEKQ